MIDDSLPWKEDLWKISLRLEVRTKQARWTERTYFLIERDIMIAAYAVRRLREACKLSDAIRGKTLLIKSYPLKGQVPDLMNRHRIDENYNLEDFQEIEIGALEFCNQVIHSYNWLVARWESGGFAGIFLSSDRARKSHLYNVSAKVLIDLYRSVAIDDIQAMHMVRDGTGQWVIRTADPWPVNR